MPSAGGCASASRRCLAGPKRRPASARRVTVVWPASAGCSRSPPRPTISSGCASWSAPWGSHGRTLPRVRPATAESTKIDAETCFGERSPTTYASISHWSPTNRSVRRFFPQPAHVRFQGSGREYSVPLQREGIGLWMRTAGDRIRRRRLSKLSCAGWLPHDRGFVSRLPRSKDERRSRDRLITGQEGSPPWPCRRRCAPAVCLWLSTSRIAVGGSGGCGDAAPRSVAAVAARYVDGVQLLEIELDEGLQLVRQSRPVQTGRQIVEPGPVLVLKVNQCRDRRGPALGSRRGRRAGGPGEAQLSRRSRARRRA